LASRDDCRWQLKTDHFWSVRSASRICPAPWSMLRCRPARRGAAAIQARVNARPAAGVRCHRQHRHGVPARELVTEGGHRRGVELAQQRPQLVGLPLPSPDHRLLGAGQGLDRLSLLTVARGRAVMGAVGAHDLGERVRIARVALRSRRDMSFSISRPLQRVDRIDHVTGGNQRPHPWTAVGLDPDQHRARI
jgi:hypothetical protein